MQVTGSSTEGRGRRASGGPAPLAHATAERSWTLVLGVALVFTLWAGFHLLAVAHFQDSATRAWTPTGVDALVALEAVLIPLAVAAGLVSGLDRRWSRYGLTTAPPAPSAFALAVVAAAALSAAAYRLVPAQDWLAANVLQPAGAPGWPAWGIVWALRVAGEELLVRGFLFGETAALLGGGKRGGAAAAVGLALAAGLVHAPHGALVAAAAGAVMLTLNALRLVPGGGLQATLVAHAAVDAWAVGWGTAHPCS